jgi:predicted nucleic acid-binding Zn ribbon protein
MSKPEDIWTEPLSTSDPIVALPVRTCKVCGNPFTSPTLTSFCGEDCKREFTPRGRKRQERTETYTPPNKRPKPRTIEKICEAPGCGKPFRSVTDRARFCGNGCRGRNVRMTTINTAVLAVEEGWKQCAAALRAHNEDLIKDKEALRRDKEMMAKDKEFMLADVAALRQQVENLKKASKAVGSIR